MRACPDVVQNCTWGFWYSSASLGSGLIASLSIENDWTVEDKGPFIEEGALIIEGSMRLSSMNNDVSLDDGNSIID